MKVEAFVNETEIENESGYLVAGTCVECSRCGHETESFGTTDRSVRRCLVLLREECPNGEDNFYVADDGSDI